MLCSLTVLCTLIVGGAPALESTCQQVAPVRAEGNWLRSPEKTTAVLLIHGFHFHFRDKSVPKAEFRPWQRADSTLVKELGKANDVFALAFGQNASLDTIVKQSKLNASIAELRKLGYREIVLIGHSAGGLIARHFVEDHPDAGVTKVIQISTPNGGSPLATFTSPPSQKVFLDCLTEAGRQQCLKLRTDKRIPEKIQFVCVVGKGEGNADSDGVVPCIHQWTPDLHKQGIPAVGLPGTHWEMVRDARLAESVARLVRESHGRWSAERIDQAKQEIFGK